MKAVVLNEFGDVDRLKFEDVDIPVCGKDDLLVRVRATSLNPVDWKIRSGAARAHIPVKLPYILGRDLAGEVVEKHPAISDFQAGTRVMALTNHTYAEFVAVKADVLTRIPDGMSFEQAAALPLVVLTGAQLIERAIQPQAGQKVLVTGALGGVGRTAVYVARTHGIRVIAGVRSFQKDEARSLGVDEVVALDDHTEIDRLGDLDAIADTVGGETITQLYKALRKGGLIGSVLGPPKGAEEQGIHFEAIMVQPDPFRLADLANDVVRGKFTIPIARSLPLHQIREAHKMGEKGGTGGKIILIP